MEKEHKPPTPRSWLSLKFTPLSIIACFVTLTEVVLGYALTQVSGAVQVALTIFVMGFAILVAGGFFLILWSRPFVFYPPSEYGNVDPKKYIEAIRPKLPPKVEDQIKKAKEIEQKPSDQDSLFKMIDTLIKDDVRQHVILMNDKHITFSLSGFQPNRYKLEPRSGGYMTGTITGQTICEQLGGTGLIELTPQGVGIQLTSTGREFASWLVETNRKAVFFESTLGKWGTPTLDGWESVPGPDLPDGFAFSDRVPGNSSQAAGAPPSQSNSE